MMDRPLTATQAASFELPSVDLKAREIHSVGATWEWIIDGALVHEDRVDSSGSP